MKYKTIDDSVGDKKDKFGMKSAIRHQIKKNYNLHSVVGKGAYASVSKGKCLKSGVLVAVKILDISSVEYDLIKVLREIQLLRRLNYLQSLLNVQKDSFIPMVYEIICPLKVDANADGTENEPFLL